jgi:hypothetical protein
MNREHLLPLMAQEHPRIQIVDVSEQFETAFRDALSHSMITAGRPTELADGSWVFAEPWEMKAGMQYASSKVTMIDASRKIMGTIFLTSNLESAGTETIGPAIHQPEADDFVELMVGLKKAGSPLYNEFLPLVTTQLEALLSERDQAVVEAQKSRDHIQMLQQRLG